MATDLSTLVDSFKREVATPGTFATTYPSTSENDILGTLADGFAEAQLDGFFPTYTLDPDTSTVTNTADADPTTNGLSLAGQALVVIYAGTRMIRAAFQASKATTRYKAGPVEYETSSSATVVVQLLRDLGDRKKAMIDLARGQTVDYVLDAYYGRLTRFFPDELPRYAIAGRL
jgi:hypothetical protein